MSLDQVNQAAASSKISSAADAGGNVQMAFAMLQMNMGALMKENAMGYINDIKQAQEQAKQISEAIAVLRNLKSSSSSYKSLPGASSVDSELSKAKSVYSELQVTRSRASNSSTTRISKESTDFILNTLKSRGESNFEDLLRGNDSTHYKYEIEGGIKSLDSYMGVLENYKSALSTLASLGIDTSVINDGCNSDKLQTLIENLQSKSETATASIQQQMVFVQDYIGQYNSYVQGASSAISSANQVLTNIARGQ